MRKLAALGLILIATLTLSACKQKYTPEQLAKKTAITKGINSGFFIKFHRDLIGRYYGSTPKDGNKDLTSISFNFDKKTPPIIPLAKTKGVRMVPLRYSESCVAALFIDEKNIITHFSILKREGCNTALSLKEDSQPNEKKYITAFGFIPIAEIIATTPAGLKLSAEGINLIQTMSKNQLPAIMRAKEIARKLTQTTPPLSVEEHTKLLEEQNKIETDFKSFFVKWMQDISDDIYAYAQVETAAVNEIVRIIDQNPNSKVYETKQDLENFIAKTYPYTPETK